MSVNNSSNVRGSNWSSSIGLIGQILEFNIKDDDFSAWVERFKLFVLLNEINAHQEKSVSYIFG